MKKYISMFTWMVVSLILLIGCNNSSKSISTKEVKSTVTKTDLNQSANTTDWKATTYETINNFDGVIMTVKKGTVSTNGLTVVFENNSSNMCIYGEKFELEKKINGKWHQVPDILDGNYGFNSSCHNVSSGHNEEWKVDWQWLYGSLDTGEYRIVKDVLDVRKPGDYDTYFLAAEFTI